MEFSFETAYGQKACTAMARALRKTVRKKRSRRTRLFGCVAVVLAVLLSIPKIETIAENGISAVTGNLILNVAAVLLIIGVLLFEDPLNGYIAKKRMLAGMSPCKAVFTDDGYRSETALGKTAWNYETPLHALAEDASYFIFLFGENHAQVYDKQSLHGGTEEEFRTFITEKIGLPMVNLR